MPVTVTRTHDSLVIRDTGRVLATLLLCFAIVLAYKSAFGGAGVRETIGAGLGALVCLVGAVACSQRLVVRFDVQQGSVRWRRERWLTAAEEKTLSLDRVQDVVIEPASGSDTITTHRATMITADGQRLPLSGYGADKRAVADLATTVLDLVHREKSREDLVQNSIRELVSQNRIIDAVKLAREEYGLDVGKAREFVLGMRKD